MFCLFILRGRHPDPSTNVWATWHTTVVYILMIASRMIGDLAHMTLDISIERDWYVFCVGLQV